MKIRKYTDWIIYHHSLSADVSVSEIKHWHITENGWKDVGYNFVLRANGAIEDGRPVDLQGAHDSIKNPTGNDRDPISVGVCLTGNFNEYPPTHAQLESSAALYVEMCEKYGKRLKIGFHREKPDPCPGKMLDRTDFRHRLNAAYFKYKNQEDEKKSAPVPALEPELPRQDPYMSPEKKEISIGVIKSFIIRVFRWIARLFRIRKK